MLKTLENNRVLKQDTTKNSVIQNLRASGEQIPGPSHSLQPNLTAMPRASKTITEYPVQRLQPSNYRTTKAMVFTGDFNEDESGPVARSLALKPGDRVPLMQRQSQEFVGQRSLPKSVFQT